MNDLNTEGQRTVHLARLINRQGEISPLCAVSPRALNLKKESWTTQVRYVTCLRCQAKIRGRVQKSRGAE